MYPLLPYLRRDVFTIQVIIILYFDITNLWSFNSQYFYNDHFDKAHDILVIIRFTTEWNRDMEKVPAFKFVCQEAYWLYVFLRLYWYTCESHEKTVHYERFQTWNIARLDLDGDGSVMVWRSLSLDWRSDFPTGPGWSNTTCIGSALNGRLDRPTLIKVSICGMSWRYEYQLLRCKPDMG
jgi:hypothetical protein